MGDILNAFANKILSTISRNWTVLWGFHKRELLEWSSCCWTVFRTKKSCCFWFLLLLHTALVLECQQKENQNYYIKPAEWIYMIIEAFSKKYFFKKPIFFFLRNCIPQPVIAGRTETTQAETEAWTGRLMKVTLGMAGKGWIVMQGISLSLHFFILYPAYFQHTSDQDHHRKILVDFPTITW